MSSNAFFSDLLSSISERGRTLLRRVGSSEEKPDGAGLIALCGALLSGRGEASGTAMASVIAVNVWRGFPFFGISFLAGMKAVPAELYEAAAVDGATAVQRFRHVTLPGIRNIVIIVVLLSTIWTFNDFAIVYILTKGGPGGATMVLPVFTYELAFGAQRLGDAIAVALYMLPPLAIVIIVLARYMRRGHAR